MNKDIIRAFGFRRLALVASVALPFFISFSALAQNPAAVATPPATAGAAEAERVIVTGSNIPTAEEVTAAPVDTLNTQEIAPNRQSGGVDHIAKAQP